MVMIIVAREMARGAKKSPSHLPAVERIASSLFMSQSPLSFYITAISRCSPTVCVSGAGADQEPTWSEFYTCTEAAKSRPNPHRPLHVVLGPGAWSFFSIISKFLNLGRALAYSCLTISTEISTAGIVPRFSSQCMVFLSSGQPTPSPYSVATPSLWSVIFPCRM